MNLALLLLARLWRFSRRAAIWTLPLLFLAVVGALFVFIIFPAADLWLVWRVYRGYLDTVSNLTGVNTYLLTAAALLAFVPFYHGVHLILRHPFDARKRWTGITILLVLAVGYNVSLYFVVRETTFGFRSGVAHKFYAVTPTGVRFYDRPGVDPEYGITLQPVTRENVRDLQLLAAGEFVPVHPASTRWFNPLTGAAELWYWRHEETLEFYNKPGFQPRTGERLLPVTGALFLEWQQRELAKLKAEEAAWRTLEMKKAAKSKADDEERQREAARSAVVVEEKCQKLRKERRSEAPGPGIVGYAWAVATQTFTNYESGPRVWDGKRWVPCP